MRPRVRFPALPWEISLNGRIPAVTFWHYILLYHHSNHRDNVTAPHGLPKLRSLLHSCHAQEGRPIIPQGHVGHWTKKNRNAFRCNEQRSISSVKRAEEELVLYIPHGKVFWTEVTRLWFASQIKKVAYFKCLQECWTKFYWLLSLFHKSVPAAARSKVWGCGRSHAEIVGSNPTGGIDVGLLWVLCFVKYRFLRRAWTLTQSSPTDRGAPLCVI